MKLTTCAKLENAVQIAVYLEKTMPNSIIDRLLGTILSYLSSHAFRLAIIRFRFYIAFSVTLVWFRYSAQSWMIVRFAGIITSH